MSIKEKPSFRNFIDNILFIISGCAYTAFYITSSLNLLAAIAVLAVTIAVAVSVKGIYGFWKTHMSLLIVFLTICIQGVLAASFYGKLSSSPKFQSIASIVGISVKPFLATATIVGIIASFYFVSAGVGFTAGIFSEDIASFKELIGKFCDESNIARYVHGLRILIVLCFAGAIISSFNASIWFDEAFTMGIIKYSIADVIRLTASDVHPPLYYIMLKIVEDVCSVISTDFTFKVIIGKLFSVAAYVLTALLCWKKFNNIKTRGFRELLVLCMFATTSAVTYSIEIRMYGWAMFFVTGAFLYAIDVIEGKASAKTWMLFMGFSLCGAYTHNYALVSVAVIWLYLLIWIAKNKKDELKKWFCFGILTAVCYFPWLLVLLRQTATVSESYWISDITIVTILGYVNDLFPLFLLYIPVIIIYFLRQPKTSRKRFCYLYGALVTLTTFAAGIFLSLAMRPVFVFRYIIPSIICLWITILTCWRGMSKELKIIVAFMIVSACVLFESGFVFKEFKLGKQAAEVVAFVNSLGDDDIVCVEYDDDYDHLPRTVAAYMDREIYQVANGENTLSDLSHEIFPKLNIADSSVILDFLNEGRTVYFITANDETEKVAWENVADYTLLGKYTFEYKASVYKITQ